MDSNIAEIIIYLCRNNQSEPNEMKIYFKLKTTQQQNKEISYTKIFIEKSIIEKQFIWHIFIITKITNWPILDIHDKKQHCLFNNADIIIRAVQLMNTLCNYSISLGEAPVQT